MFEALLLLLLALFSSVNTTVSFMSVLNRMGLTTSYQYIGNKRRETIEDWKEFGPFTTLSPGAFVAVDIDNINMRSTNSLAVHGGTYHGFDGLAMQAMNCNESFDFGEYCRSRSPEDHLPKKLHLSRNYFIEENFPTQDDVDIAGYRHLVVGLAVNKQRGHCQRGPQENKSTSTSRSAVAARGSCCEYSACACGRFAVEEQRMRIGRRSHLSNNPPLGPQRTTLCTYWSVSVRAFLVQLDDENLQMITIRLHSSRSTHALRQAYIRFHPPLIRHPAILVPLPYPFISLALSLPVPGSSFYPKPFPSTPTRGIFPPFLTAEARSPCIFTASIQSVPKKLHHEISAPFLTDRVLSRARSLYRSRNIVGVVSH